jgi:hypothetical protein
MAEDAMSWDGCRVIAFSLDQLATAQQLERSLDSALRQAGLFRERTQTGRDGSPSCARGLAVKMEKNEIRGRLAIVPNDVAHQNVEDVIVHEDGFAETRHAKSKKEELGIKKGKIQALY